MTDRVDQNAFETLGLEPRFDLDEKRLAERHRALSGKLHPDRYSGRPASERRMALDRAIQVNEAYRQLRDPVRRAEALLKAKGVPVGELKEPQASPALLMEMMEVRESLDEARQKKDLDRVGVLGDEMRGRETAIMQRLSQAFSDADDSEQLQAALPILGELRYVRRFFEELEAIEEALMDG